MVNTALAPEQFKKIAIRNTTIPLIICIILTVIFTATIQHLTSVLRSVDHTNQVLAKTHYTGQLAIEAQNGLRGFMLTQDQDFLLPYLDSKDQVLKEWEALEKLTSDNPIQTIQIQEAKKAQELWLQFALETLQAKSAEDMMKKERLLESRLQMQTIRKSLDEISRIEESLLKERTTGAQKAINRVLILIIISGLFTGGFIAFYSRRQLANVSDSYSEVLQKIGIHNARLEKQDRLKSLQVKLSQQNRGILNLNQIAHFVLNTISETIGSNIGAMYLSYDDKYLKLLASRSISDEDLKKRQQINYGESLQGTVAKEKTIQIFDLPEENLTLNSAIINLKTRKVIIYPIIHNDIAIGVLELGLSRDVIDEDLEILEMLTETAAIIIDSAKQAHKVQELLEDTRRYAEELQSQQEELKTANEELEQQAYALKETHQRLQNQQAELEQTNQQLEEQTQILEHQKIDLDDKNKILIESRKNLEEKSQEILKASQYKSEFLANMSHELRTPLNSTLILAKLLSENKNGSLTKEQVKYADIIYSSSSDLLNLINDILDLSKVEAGKMNILPERINLKSFISNIEAIFSIQTQNKGLTFNVHFEENVPEYITTDRLRLDQILKNLLSNALKFTGKGSIELKLSFENNHIVFSVKDSGIGIKKDQQDTIFEAFRQADGTTNRKYGGTGLGLSISKELTELLKGNLIVDSVLGKGSTFSLYLPLDISEAKRVNTIQKTEDFDEKKIKVDTKEIKFNFKDDRDDITATSRKILVIEDDEQFARVLFDLAHENNFKCIVVPSAKEGLKQAQLLRPEAIILDVRLPDNSGLTVLDQLKTDGKTRHIPVHVISAEDFSRPVLEMGAVGHMLKPLEKAQLVRAFQTLSQVLDKKDKWVLIVEDDEVQKNYIEDLIKDKNVQVDTAMTATDALEKLSQRTYDCMIMDLSLPDLSGHELLSKLANENDKYSYPPVIVYTARDLTSDEEDKLRKYSGSIIIKGAKSPERLLNEVTLFLHRVETDLPPERQKMLTDLRTREKSLADKSILLVDDDIRNIFALTAALESLEANIVIARNGKEAIEKIESNQIDMVLMDIMMPEMDGYEAMRRIRSKEQFKDLPILALTAKAMKDDHEKCLEAGANDYLAKPINVEKLISLIRVWLPQQRNFIK